MTRRRMNRAIVAMGIYLCEGGDLTGAKSTMVVAGFSTKIGRIRDQDVRDNQLARTINCGRQDGKSLQASAKPRLAAYG